MVASCAAPTKGFGMSEVIEGERSIASVMHDVVGNLGRIIRAEVRLARIEIAEKLAMAAQATGRAATLLVAGVVVGQLALGFLLVSLLRAIEMMVAPWLAALLVAVGAAAVAGVCLVTGLKQHKRLDLLSLKRIASPIESTR